MKHHDINTIINYEAKILRRNILFRVFAILSILGILFLQITRQGGNITSWFKIALPSSFPFVTAYLYNFIQALVIIFVCSGQYRNPETQAVILCRPVSNHDYCIGKWFGIFKEFLKINLYVFILAALVNIWGSYAPFRVDIYLFYFLTSTLPTLIFTSGLTLWVSQMTRNHFLTTLFLTCLLLGSYFYFSKIQYGIFDFFSYSQLNTFSDVTGYTGLSQYLQVRVGYTFLGIACLYLWISMFQRLDNKPPNKYKAYIVPILFILLGSSCILNSWYYFNRYENRRKAYKETYLHYQPEKKARVIKHDITYRPTKGSMTVTSKLEIQNQTQDTLQHILIYLNPTLQVTSIQHENQILKYTRENQIILVHKKLIPEEKLILHMEYQGQIDDALCYLEIPDQDIRQEKRIKRNQIFQFGKQYTFLDENYTLLLPECIWYPVCVPPVNISFPYAQETNFTQFSLEVYKNSDAEVISQGMSEASENKITFINPHPLTSISLCIGKYNKEEVTVDNTLLELYYFPGHEFILDFNTMTGSQIKKQLARSKNKIQSTFGRYYPFKKLTFIESPVSFTSYERNWREGSDYIQPELIFFPERLFSLSSYSPLETAKKILRKRNPLEDQEALYAQAERHVLQICEIQLSDGMYSLSPMFHDYLSFISSDEYPGVNTLLNNVIYYQKRIIPINTEFSKEYLPAVEYLKNHSLKEAFSDKQVSNKLLREIIKSKALYLRAYLSTRVPFEDLKQFFDDIASRLRFAEITLEEFSSEFSDRYSLDIQQILNELYQEKGLAFFHVKDLQASKIPGQENIYQIHFKIWNSAQTAGVITFTAHDTGNDFLVEKSMPVPAKICQEFYLEVAGEPQLLHLQTHLAQNIPSAYFIYYEHGIHKTSDEKPSGIFALDSSVFLSDDIIVDDASHHFHLVDSTEQIKKLIPSKSKQDRYSFVSDPAQWIETITHHSYGEPIRSAHCKLAGRGDKKAIWTTELPEPGIYEIFFYHQDISITYPPVSSTFTGAKLYYTIRHGNEEKEIIIEADLEAEGWVSLGKHSLPKGEVQVILSDKGDTVEKDNTKQGMDAKRQLIIADAIKYVRVKRNP